MPALAAPANLSFGSEPMKVEVHLSRAGSKKVLQVCGFHFCISQRPWSKLTCKPAVEGCAEAVPVTVEIRLSPVSVTPSWTHPAGTTAANARTQQQRMN